MAFIDLPTVGERTSARPSGLPGTLAPASLSGLEWLVIAIARSDDLSTLRTSGRIARAMGALFGAPQNPRLAAERLEALRRIAVLSWHFGRAVPCDEFERFIDAGFAVGQYELMLASIARGRSAARSLPR